MTITPNEIADRKFTVRFKGYDRQEVNSFLEEVANVLADLIKDRNELRDDVLALEKRISKLKDQEAEFRKALTAAHQLAGDMKANAEKEAEIIIQRAMSDAERIVAEAHQEAINLEGRLRQLRMLQREAVEKIRSSMEGFLRILDDEMTGPPPEIDEALKVAATTIQSIQKDSEELEFTERLVVDEDLSGLNIDAVVEGIDFESKEPDIGEQGSLADQEDDGNFDEKKKKPREDAGKNKESASTDMGFDPGKIWPDD